MYSNFNNYLDKFDNKNGILVSITLLMIKGVDTNPYFTKYFDTHIYDINDGMCVYNIITGYKDNIY